MMKFRFLHTFFVTVLVSLCQRSAIAETFTFDQGSIKSITLSGNWKRSNDSHSGDYKWSQSFEQALSQKTIASLPKTIVSVAVHELRATATIKRILSEPPHVLSNEEKRHINSLPVWILQYVIERGAPITRKVGSDTVLYNKFEQPQKAMMRFPDGKRGCANRVKYEVHVFALSGNDLIDLSLCRTDYQSSNNIIDKITHDYERILNSVEWR